MTKNSEWEKLLDVKFDNNLTFEKQITDICRRASRETYARLARLFRTWTTFVYECYF